jgi:hypothetical protein
MSLKSHLKKGRSFRSFHPRNHSLEQLGQYGKNSFACSSQKMDDKITNLEAA